MKTAISIIKNKKRNQFVTIWDHIPALMSNGFSVLFASTIAYELRNVVSGAVLIVLAGFVVWFLIVNEVFKVKAVRRVFKGQKGSIFTMLFTFLVSVILASIGIYLLTCKSSQTLDNSTIEKTEMVNKVKASYETKVQAVNEKTFESTGEYAALEKDLNYWKSRGSASIEERNEIRERVNRVQVDMQAQRVQFNESKKASINKLNDLMAQEIAVIDTKFVKAVNGAHKNDFLSYIFLALILVTEFATVMLNKGIAEKELNEEALANSDIAKEYELASALMLELFLGKNSENYTNINKAKYSHAAKRSGLQWEDLRNIYNRFVDMGILGDKSEVGTLVSHRFMVSNKEAVQLIEDYYDKMLSIG